MDVSVTYSFTHLHCCPPVCLLLQVLAAPHLREMARWDAPFSNPCCRSFATSNLADSPPAVTQLHLLL